MGVFDRMARLIKANINDLISRAEDPVKMIDQILLELDEQLAEAKRRAVPAIAAEKRFAVQLKQETDAAAEWKHKAELAVRAGKEDLAREALLRHGEHDARRKSYEERLTKQQKSVETLKKTLQRLREKIEEARRKRDELIIGLETAEAVKTAAVAMDTAQNTSLFGEFERQKQAIERRTAEADAAAELAGEHSADALAWKLEEMERAARAEDALMALKREMGLVATEPTREQVRVEPAAAPATAPAAEVQQTSAADQAAADFEQDELAAALAELEEEERQAQRRAQR